MVKVGLADRVAAELMMAPEPTGTLRENEARVPIAALKANADRMTTPVALVVASVDLRHAPAKYCLTSSSKHST